jgi:hypothetical protein
MRTVHFSMRRTILYILSSNYSGSHFLSLLLGSHSQAMHIGEVNHLRKPMDRGTCQTCGTLERCELLGGITPDEIHRIYDIVFSRVGNHIRLLVDNSKRLAWAECFVGERTYARKFVHLIRDPRALARRWVLYYPHRTGQMKQRWQAVRAFPHRALRFAMAGQPEVYAYRWLAENRRITEFVRRHHLDSVMCTYEELATAQSEHVQRITEWAGLHYEPGQLEYWCRAHHGTQKEEYGWIKDKQARYFDCRWKTFLPSRDAATIARNEDVQEYLTACGLRMADDGLVRVRGLS